MGTQLWAILRDGFRESLDRKMFWVVATMTLLIVVVMACISFEPDRIVLLFGVWRIPADGFDATSEMGKSQVLSVMIQFVMSTLLGWIGMMLMIIATADFFPSMMERGAIDVVLSKPLPRWVLFLFKYLGSLAFVLLQATLFVVLTFLVMGLRWNIWAPGYLVAIPLMVLLFSYIYCVSVYVGVVTRSTVAAILISICAWAAYVLPPAAAEVIDSEPTLRANQALVRAVGLAAAIPPKTADIDYIASRWARAGTSLDLMPQDQIALPPEERERIRERELRKIAANPAYSIGSSLLFEAVVVGLAMWRFCRSDF